MVELSKKTHKHYGFHVKIIKPSGQCGLDVAVKAISFQTLAPELPGNKHLHPAT